MSQYVVIHLKLDIFRQKLQIDHVNCFKFKRTLYEYIMTHKILFRHLRKLYFSHKISM